MESLLKYLGETFVSIKWFYNIKINPIFDGSKFLTLYEDSLRIKKHKIWTIFKSIESLITLSMCKSQIPRKRNEVSF